MIKKFKSLSIIFVINLLIIFNITIVIAHSPSNMDLSYDSDNELLDVRIMHSVADPDSHYIDSVIVDLNGNNIITKTYYSQPSTSTFTYQYNLQANDGDMIRVTAICSISGSITESLIIGETSTGQDDSSEIPGYSCLWFFIIPSIGLIMYLIHKKIRKV